MKERSITITIDQAVELFNSGNASLREVALQAFNEDELKNNFMKITTFNDACKALGLNYDAMSVVIKDIAKVSKAAAAIFQLNIIRKALHLGYNLSLIEEPENSRIYCPFNPFVTEESTYYLEKLNSGAIEIIGEIKSEGVLYKVLGDSAEAFGFTGVGSFNSYTGVGYTCVDDGFLGCASEGIAQHFSKYFGMLITEAKFGDMIDFEIAEDKYGNTK